MSARTFSGQPVRVGNPPFGTQGEKLWRRHSAGTIAAQFAHIHTPYRAACLDHHHGKTRRVRGRRANGPVAVHIMDEWDEAHRLADLRYNGRLCALPATSGKCSLPAPFGSFATTFASLFQVTHAEANDTFEER